MKPSFFLSRSFPIMLQVAIAMCLVRDIEIELITA